MNPSDNSAVLSRRSIIGSLRSASPFASPSIVAGSGSRTETIQSSRATPRSQRGILIPIHEEERFPPPELDRTVDLLLVSDTPIDRTQIFEQLLLDKIGAQQGHDLFRLPASVRRRIYYYCFPEEARKITLSPRFATKAVFPDDHFSSAWDMLEPVSGGLRSFRALRYELMTYFWTEYHFHVTLTPFSGPRFSPLSHVWLLDYLEIIQYLTVEADLTRFGCSALKIAPQFGYDMTKIENLLVGVTNGLLKRRNRSTMAEFNIMCRRYAGFRPYDDSDDVTFKYDPIRYCPDEALYLCDALCNLRGILRKSRISGFTLPYTELLLSAIFAEGDIEPQYITPEDCAWPPIPLQSAFTSFGSSLNPVSMAPMSQFELSFSHSSSFAQDFEDEMLKYESSVYSDNTDAPADEMTVDKEPPLRNSHTITTVTDQVQKYQHCLSSIDPSDKSNYGRSQNDNSDHVCGTEIRFLDSTMIRTTKNESGRGLLSTTPSKGSRCSTPKSPNTMNQLNEQDPAFLRTLNALRSLDDTPSKPLQRRRPKSMIPSPKPNPKPNPAEIISNDRCKTSMSGRQQSVGAVRRYLTFVDRLRGRADLR